MRLILLAVMLALVAGGCGGGGEEGARTTTPAGETTETTEYPKPLAKDLAKPFTGEPVASAWLGKWRDEPSGIEWSIFEADSPECRAITAGRTSCFAFGPPGSSATDPSSLYAAGAISLDANMVVLRMTYTPLEQSVRCFSDDAYRYELTPERVVLVKDDRKHCFYERAEAEANPQARKLNAFTFWTRIE